MAASTLTRRGQVTLPEEVRKALRLRAGDQVSFVPLGRGRYEIVAARGPAKVAPTLFGRPARSVSIEDVNAGLGLRGKAK